MLRFDIYFRSCGSCRVALASAFFQIFRIGFLNVSLAEGYGFKHERFLLGFKRYRVRAFFKVEIEIAAVIARGVADRISKPFGRVYL